MQFVFPKFLIRIYPTVLTSAKEAVPASPKEKIGQSSKAVVNDSLQLHNFSANEPGDLGSETWSFLHDSVMNMLDVPLSMESFMSVNDVLLELAMYEDLQAKSVKDGKGDSSG